MMGDFFDRLTLAARPDNQPAQIFKRKSKLDFNYQNLQIVHLLIF